MQIIEFREAQKIALKDEGIKAFEKYIGKIEWLHSNHSTDIVVKSDKTYAAVDVTTGKVAVEADKMACMAKELCTSTCSISKCLNLGKLLNERYMIVRCENE